MGKRLLLIVNLFSGQKRAKQHLADILYLFQQHQYIPTVMMTQYQGHAVELVKEHGKNADLIVCIGGDGTFNEVINGILQGNLQIPLGYIPAGSTNDFANSMKLPKNMKKAAQLIINGSARSVDIGLFNQRYFSYVASFGAFTKTSYSTPQNVKNALGHLAYILEGIKDIPSIRPIHMKLKTADAVLEGDYLFGAISNSTSVGGILTLDKNIVDMNDGKFEILLLKAPTTINELNDIVLALTKQDYSYPSITFCSASEIEIEAPADTIWTLDGEKADEGEHLFVKNLHSAVQLIL
jgi:YegS/Rv2252/BmrU family lipid kinase